MDTTFQQCLEGCPWLSILAWLVATALVNAVLRRPSPEAWEALARDRPRVAALLRIWRALGFDGHKLAQALGSLLAGAPPPDPGSKPTPKEHDDEST